MCRGKTATTSPGRLFQRLAVLITTEVLVSVRKYIRRISAMISSRPGISSKRTFNHGLGPVSTCTVVMNTSPGSGLRKLLNDLLLLLSPANCHGPTPS